MNILLDNQKQIDFSKTFKYSFDSSESGNTVAQLNPVIETNKQPNTSFSTESLENILEN